MSPLLMKTNARINENNAFLTLGLIGWHPPAFVQNPPSCSRAEVVIDSGTKTFAWKAFLQQKIIKKIEIS